MLASPRWAVEKRCGPLLILRTMAQQFTVLQRVLVAGQRS
jgi:hypothetical protein